MNQIDVAFHLDRERVAPHDAVLTSCDVIEQQEAFVRRPWRYLRIGILHLH